MTVMTMGILFGLMLISILVLTFMSDEAYERFYPTVMVSQAVISVVAVALGVATA